jgi:DNA-directed RNA polymerase alpha subunit
VIKYLKIDPRNDIFRVKMEIIVGGKKEEDPIVLNISYKEILPNTGLIPAEIKKEVEAVLPKDIKRASVKFELHNVDVSIANAIRRTILEEIKTKALSVSKIDTNEEFIIPAEITDRISSIPIDQTIPDNTKYAVDISNLGKKSVYVTSANIVGHEKKQYFTNNIKIARLREGKYLKIPEITVESGYGYNHAKFMISNDVGYYNLDVMSANVLNEKANTTKKQVLVSDVIKEMKAAKFSQEEIETITKKPYRADILIIPDPVNEKRLTPDESKKITKFHKTIIRAPIQAQSSFVTQSKNFLLKVRTKGNINIKTLIPAVCDNIIERLEKVKKSLPNIKSFKYKTSTVNSLLIENETYTIGELIRKHVFMLNPTIACLKNHVLHPRDRNAYIELIHPEPAAIITKAADHCIGVFKQIKGSF